MDESLQSLENPNETIYNHPLDTRLESLRYVSNSVEVIRNQNSMSFESNDSKSPMTNSRLADDMKLTSEVVSYRKNYAFKNQLSYLEMSRAI